ncbi:hypothetical protein K4H28_02070 [Deefgea tanakiae]|uniref:Polysaccharide biosynthesis protein n=1 Tax=Deefgea tanakiae TaxID=2865840 RepID=A0ABX8Z6L8_9NEIS|nr:hypothetical protein [Deefgea tanakiae]QZA78232.1 hypothetical protein K4H28_02070 [Deefgea tanakiae]
MKIPKLAENELVLTVDQRANKFALWIVGFATVYQFILCLAMSFRAPMGSSVLMLAELIVYLLCFYVFYERRWSVNQLAVFWFAITNLFLLFLFRSSLDLKSIRDVLIPILFFILGLRFAQYEKTDRFVFGLTIVLIVIAIFEMSFPTLYGKFLPTLQFQASTGAVNPAGAMHKGQMLTLNSFRPEGIGRTWFPGLLSNQRAASMFIEPVSFGNFAVILSAWGLARPLGKRMWQYLGLVLVILILTDSRFATLLVALLMVIRFTPLGLIKPIVIAKPAFIIILLLLIANLGEYAGDNLIGRLFIAGNGLKNTPLLELLGATRYASGYGDLGYSYVISRFGLIFITIAWLTLFFAFKGNTRAEYFRIMLGTYFACILAVSGTSLFALKTAALAWFMLGVVFAFKKEIKFNRSNPA